MLKSLGIESTTSLILMISVILLVGVTPLGDEASYPAVLLLYRTLLFVIAIFCVSQVYRREGLSVCPAFIGVAATALLLMLPSFVFASGSNYNGFSRWYDHALLGAVFIALAAFNHGQPARWKYTILGTVVAIDVAYLAIELALGHRPVIGPFVNPNYFASYLLVGFSIGVAVFLFGTGRWLRVAGAIVSLFLYYGMTQAWSRGATLCAIGVVGLAALRFSRRHSVSWTKLAAPLVALLLAGFLASPVLIRKFLDRGEGDPYNYMRPKVWMSTLAMIGENPIFGFGLGSYAHAAKQFTPAAEGAIARYRSRMGIAHSEYLQYAAEIGLPATLLLLGLAGYLVHRAVRNTAHSPAGSRAIHEAAILSAAGIGAHALIDNNWTVPVMAAGLVVFSLADSLPRRKWNFRYTLQPRTAGAAAVMIGLLIYLHSTFIPFLGLYFIHAGHRAHLARNLDRAESLHRMAVAIIPDQPGFLDITGMLYLDIYRTTRDQRFLDFADHFFESAMAADTNADEPRRHMEMALIERLTGDAPIDKQVHLRIIQIDRDLLRIDPFDPFTRKNLAEALYHSGFRQEADQEMLKTIEVEPNFIPAYTRLAEWRQREGDTEQSAKLRKEAMSIAALYEHVEPAERYEALLLGRLDPAMKPTVAVSQ